MAKYGAAGHQEKKFVPRAFPKNARRSKLVGNDGHNLLIRCVLCEYLRATTHNAFNRSGAIRCECGAHIQKVTLKTIRGKRTQVRL